MHRGTLVPLIAGLFCVVLTATAGADLAGTVLASEQKPLPAGVRSQEWWLDGLDAYAAWRYSEGAGVTVAVLSTGVAASAPDLAGAVTTGPDYTDSGRYAGGPFWGICGTAVASIIAGHGHGPGNSSGVIGIAPKTSILSVRVMLEYDDPLNASTAMTSRLADAVASGIRYAVDHGAKIIDLPLDPVAFGMPGDSVAAGGSAAERAAVEYAVSKGVLLIAPSGDDGPMPSQVDYPAAYPGVLAVGATGQAGQIAPFSNRHAYSVLSAPGIGLMAAAMVPAQTPAGGWQPGYKTISTTSVASGMVAGTAALIASRFPALTANQIGQALRESARGGAGVVNVLAAVRRAERMAGSGRQAVASKPGAGTSAAGGSARGGAAAGSAARGGSAGSAGSAGTEARSGAQRHVESAPGAGSGGSSAVSVLTTRALRDAAVVAGGLIALLAALIVASRRRRRGRDRKAAAVPRGVTAAHGAAGSPAALGGPWPVTAGATAGAAAASGGRARVRVRGQHEDRRNPAEKVEDALRAVLREQAQSGSQAAAGQAWHPSSEWPATSSWRTDDDAPASTGPVSWPDDRGWPHDTGWQGRGIGEIAHSSDVPGILPAIIPLPKSASRSWSGGGNGSPPWEPAPQPSGEPAGLMQHLPLGDVPATELPVFPEPEVEARLQDLPVAHIGPDLTAPFAGRDVLTQGSYGLAAAPVPGDYPAPGGPEPTSSTIPLPQLPTTDEPED